MQPDLSSCAVTEPAARRKGAQGPDVAMNASLDLFAGDRSFVMSFARGMAVIHAFANVSRALTIAEISHRTEIPRAAVRRLLHTLAELGYVRSVGSRYVLAPKTLELGHAFTSSNDGALAAQAVVARLAERLGAFCAVSLPEGDDAMLLCMAGSAHADVDIERRLVPCAGGKSPLYAGASGLVFLSEYSAPQLAAYFRRVAMRPLTFRTPTLPAQLHKALQVVRAQGHAISDRTFAEHLRSVAMPVRDAQGSVIAATLVVLQASQMDDVTLRETILPQLRLAVREIAAHWG